MGRRTVDELGFLAHIRCPVVLTGKARSNGVWFQMRSGRLGQMPVNRLHRHFTGIKSRNSSHSLGQIDQVKS